MTCAVLAILAFPCRSDTVVWDNNSQFLCASYSCFFHINDPLADDFQLAGPANITSMRFWATESVWSSFDGTVGWAFYTHNGSGPGTLLYSGTDSNLLPVDTGLTAGQGGLSIQTIDLGFTEVNLAAGTYWVALRADPWGTPQAWTNLGWLETTRGKAVGGQLPGLREGLPDESPTAWSSLLGELAFTLSTADPVPEPSTSILVLPVLVIIGRREWCRLS